LQRLLEEDGGCNLFSKMAVDRVHQARQLMITLILGTDSSKHLAELSAFRVRIGADSFDPISDIADQHITLGMIFRAADIGHSAKDWPLHETWSYRVVQEFHEQGDEEKRLGLAVSPLCDRDGFDMSGSQCGFLQFICLPTWKELAHLENHLYERTEPPQRTAQKRTSITSRTSRTSGDSQSSWGSWRSKTHSFTKSNPGSSPTAVWRSEGAGDLGTVATPNAKPSSDANRPRSTRKDSRKSSAILIPLASVSKPPSDIQMTAEEEFEAVVKRTASITEVCVAFCEGNLEKWREKGKEDPGLQQANTDG